MAVAYLVFADLVAIVHAAYALFVVMGLVLIVAGAARGWNWIRDARFRLAHLLAILFVAAESVAGIACPLTVLESHLREWAGRTGYGGDFISAWVDWLIFYNLPPWLFTLAYLATAALIAGLFIVAPPHWRGGRRAAAASRSCNL